MAGLGEGEEFLTGSGYEKDDDRVGAGPDKVADVAVGEADEGQEDAQGDQLGTPTFHKSRFKQNRPRVPFG